MNTIKFAVVGCGHIGKRHTEMIVKTPDAGLVALCDILPMEKLGLNNYQIPFFTSVDDLVNSKIDIDVICICTPNGLHAEHAIAALKSNRHVVIEKPMALNKKDCELIIETAAVAGKKVFCVMQNRFSPPSVWIKGIIDEALLGEIYMVQVNCFWNRDERYYSKDTWHGKKDLDGGTLFTQFSHFIDTLIWLFGDIKNISAMFADFNHHQLTDFEDSGLINFSFGSGSLGSINYSSAIYDKNFESSLKIIGEKGTVEIGGQYMNEVTYCDIKNYKMPQLEKTNAANDYGSYTGSAANHHFIIQNVIDVLNNKSKVATTAEEGMKVVDTIERIYQVRDLLLIKKK
ncbi:MAG: Gfo/Idh/MocA family protein [Chitinophagales bacterium]